MATKNSFDRMHPIAAAVEPQRQHAVDRARKYAADICSDMVAKLAAAGWNLDVIAPEPRHNDESHGGRLQRELRNHYEALTAHNTELTNAERTRQLAAKTFNVFNPPVFRKRDIERETKFIDAAGNNASFQYDKFIFKLIEKCGPGVASAKIAGSHVWGYSVLTVTFENGDVQNWKTQTIVNVSKLGTVFNQFPSRKMANGPGRVPGGNTAKRI